MLSLTFSSGWVLSLSSVTAGAKKLSNKAALWYVPCSLQNVDKIIEVPPIKVQGNLNCSDPKTGILSFSFCGLGAHLPLHPK